MADKTPLRRFRAEDDLWTKFGDAVERSPDPEADMSKVLRQFLRWYVGERGAKLPARPTAAETAGAHARDAEARQP